jgi:hypothetical protein
MPAIAGAITGLATSLLGTGMSIAQMVKANKEKKAAQNAALAAKKRIEGISSENPFAAVQVPMQGYNMAMDAIRSQAAQGLQAAQGAGAEGVIGAIPGLTQATTGAALETGAQAAEAQYQLKRDQAAIQEEMNKRKEERLGELYSDELTGAQTAAATAQVNKNQAISGMFGSIGSGLSAGLGAAPLFAGDDTKRAELEKLFGNQYTNPGEE